MTSNVSDNPRNESEPGDNTLFLSWPAARLITIEALPGDLFLCIRHRMIKYKHKGDHLTMEEFDKLVFNRVRFVFIEEQLKTQFLAWARNVDDAVDKAELATIEAEAQPIAQATQEMRRAALDLFSSGGGDDASKQALAMAKKMVTEFLKKPFVINNISQLQRYGRGVVDHSVNVSVLSVFLGLRLGYSSQVILEHLAMGGLLHDLGKTLIKANDEQFLERDDPRFEQHPSVGKQALEANKEVLRDVANEVRMIVGQHHEYLDGTGYPNKLRGLAIYDLARLVTIANEYDNLVSESEGTINERAKEALGLLERDFVGKLDPKKLEKAVRAIRTGLT
jgi:putative nucleotidyltransferase with HDIG domain